MDLATLLLQKQSGILKRWFDLAVGAYQSDAVTFLRRQKDGIANPVGGSLREGLAGIFDILVEALKARSGGELAFESERLWVHVDRIVRIRAIQNFTPSESIGFFYETKDLLRKVVGGQASKAEMAAELAAVETWLDRLLFLAFDVYASCREDLFKVRLQDEQQRVHMLLRRAKLIVEREGEGVELPDLREDGPRTNHEER
jgi:hypothetical protein